MLSLHRESTLHARVDRGICDSCKQTHATVDIQYSYGVYAGVLCEPCARQNYRDHCGFRPEGQGTRADYEEMEGPGSYDGDGWEPDFEEDQ
jgi:hypothetical protein